MSILTFLKTAIALDNRFLVTKDFVANYTHECHPSGCQHYGKGNVAVSFYVKNVSDKGISIFVTSKQVNAFVMNHPKTGGCRYTNFSGIPKIGSGTSWDNARRTAVYIPKNSGLYVTVTKSECRVDKSGRLPSRVIRGGIVSGNVTVIQGRRILTRPISGRF